MWDVFEIWLSHRNNCKKHVLNKTNTHLLTQLCKYNYITVVVS